MSQGLTSDLKLQSDKTGMVGNRISNDILSVHRDTTTTSLNLTGGELRVWELEAYTSGCFGMVIGLRPAVRFLHLARMWLLNSI